VLVSPCVGALIAQPMARVPAADALKHVAGWVLCADATWPAPADVAEHYRPGLRWRARDGLCALAPTLLPLAAAPEPERLCIQVSVDGQSPSALPTSPRVRAMAALLSDISQFMSLGPGDIVLLGGPHRPIRMTTGQSLSLRLGDALQLHGKVAL
jgi:5-oxopent-3-ene-1,2,5-tricarboxylate decarboxylase / 2-hydroxyhepta-2,4-diene-1,7-dioate isomerase